MSDMSQSMNQAVQIDPQAQEQAAQTPCGACTVVAGVGAFVVVLAILEVIMYLNQG